MSDNYDEGKAAYDARDYETAFTILKPLAEQGHAEAQYNLGIMYEFGQGIEQDSKEAAKWFYMAAEQGFVKAQYNLGAMCGNGEGVEKDSKEAAQWILMAAEQRHTDAQYKLGLIYGLCEDL